MDAKQEAKNIVAQMNEALRPIIPLMRSPYRLLKHAEMHILRDIDLWAADPWSWSETQHTLKALRDSL